MHKPEPGTTRNLIAAAATVVMFAIALLVLDEGFHNLKPRQVWASLAQMPLASLAGALMFTAASYALLTLYDRLALEVVGKRLANSRVALTSFIACAFAHNLGLAQLSGGSVRLRAYTAEGLGAAEIALVQGIFSLTFALGAGALLSGSLLFESSEAAALLHLPLWACRALGVLIAAALIGYLLLSWRLRRPLKLGSWQLTLPRPALALTQFAVSMVEIGCAAAALYWLLPAESAPSYPAFLGIFVIAMLAGVISNVPGGLGVFESALLLMIPGTSSAALLGSVLAYRIVYYLIPFVLAVVLLVWRESLVLRQPLTRATLALRRSIESVLPQALAMAVFAAGIVLLISGTLPAIGERVAALSEFLPLEVLEASHLAGSAFGMGLLILARGLYRRIDGAWWLTQVLLAGGIAASLLKGVDYEEALMLLVLMGLLGVSHKRFYRRAPLTEVSLSPLWLLNVTLVIAGVVWLGLLVNRNVAYAHQLWWQFAFDADAPRMLRASLVAVVVVTAYALWSLLSAARPESQRPDAAQLGAARRCIALGGDSIANLALVGDKQLLFSEQGDAFIMYQRSGRSWIAMGDPVGNPKRYAELAWRFRELCDQHSGWCVFYQATADKLPLYLDLGLSMIKLGEEARVPLTTFTLEGPGRGELRTAQRKGGRDGLRFEVLPPSAVRQRIGELQAISEAWMSHKSTAEKGFSVGRFDADYLCNFDCAVALRGDTIVAFANLWRSGDGAEYSVDLMRYGSEAPKGVMDYLFVELMLWGKAQNAAWFNLGMAPLSGLEHHPLAPLWHRLGLLVHRYGESFYNFDGLRRYKEKFQPQWRPRYLASPGGFALPRIMLDTTALIAGGVREMVWK